MKKFRLIFSVVLGLAWSVQVNAEHIGSFDATLLINADSSVTVIERIEYHFGAIEHHGIYRDIPVTYETPLGRTSIGMSSVSVTDENDKPYRFSVSRNGPMKRITIGDPDRMITGTHVYQIRYTINRGIKYFDDHDELYWNVTGTGWEVSNISSHALVFLPIDVPPENIQRDCFVGAYGSTEHCSGIQIDTRSAATKMVRFEHGELPAGEGLTIVVGFPKGIVVQPGASAKVADFMRDNGVLFVPLLAFVLMFTLWFKRGRDPKGRGTIIAQYGPPDNLSPSEVGTIVDESADNTDIAADIVNCAVKGYVRITRIEEKKMLMNKVDYALTLLKPIDNKLAPFEQQLLRGLFEKFGTTPAAGPAQGMSEVRLSDLKDKFYTTLREVKSAIYSSVISKGYLPHNPLAVKGLYAAIGAVFSFLGFFLGNYFGAVGAVSFFLAGIIIIAFGFMMPKRTYQGVLTNEYILGLKDYLTVAEKARLEFHNAPEKNPQAFEKLLPYAMALKVEKQWAEQFKGLYTQPPNWYRDPQATQFNSLLFVQNLNSFSASTKSVLSSTPSSGGSGLGGGGFSGGGFGGGGGGSW